MRRPSPAHRTLARRLSGPLLAGVVVLAAAGTALAAAAGALSVRLDQSVRISLRAPATSVVVGNPAIADVSVIDARTILVLGKGSGVTNLVVMDQGGRVLFNREIVVSAGDAGRVSIWRGPAATSYACLPRCERESGSAAAPASASGPP
ncbi:MAG: pilus assembly protein CpaC [Caulobacter sp.]|nr:pilus assembly protein CpaC [Caulobacter sp.]